MTDYFRCPIDGAPLRSATHQINADSTLDQRRLGASVSTTMGTVHIGETRLS